MSALYAAAVVTLVVAAAGGARFPRPASVLSCAACILLVVVGLHSALSGSVATV